MKKRYLSVLFITCFINLFSGCAFPMEPKEVSAQFFAMDTYMTMDVYGANAKEVVEASKKEIYRLDDLLSIGKASSEISIINENAGGALSKDTGILVQKSMELYEDTHGIFDITIYPLMSLWGFRNQNFHVPAEEEIKEALQKVHGDALCYDEDMNTLQMLKDTKIDLGGIAKGYTSQSVVEIMKSYGVEHAMINLGGNIQVIGKKPDGSDWKIGVKDPENTERYLGVISTSDKAVITSGGYERYFEEDGIRYHHIIDPRNGYPAKEELLSVTIVCEDGTLADGLSTSLFIMGLEESIEYWRANRDEFDMVLYTSDKRLLISKGLENCFSTQNKYEVID